LELLLTQVEDVPPDAVPDSSPDAKTSSKSASKSAGGRKRQSSRSHDSAADVTSSSLASTTSAAASATTGPTCDHCQKHYNNLHPLSHYGENIFMKRCLFDYFLRTSLTPFLSFWPTYHHRPILSLFYLFYLFLSLHGLSGPPLLFCAASRKAPSRLRPQHGQVLGLPAVHSLRWLWGRPALETRRKLKRLQTRV